MPRATLLENIRAGRRDNARLGLQLSSIMALMGWSPSWSVTFSHLSDKFVELLLPAFSGAKRSEQKGHESFAVPDPTKATVSLVSRNQSLRLWGNNQVSARASRPREQCKQRGEVKRGYRETGQEEGWGGHRTREEEKNIQDRGKWEKGDYSEHPLP